MQQRGTQGMWGRYALFVALSFAILMINVFVVSIIHPRKPQGENGPVAAAPQAEPEEGDQRVRDGEAPAEPTQKEPAADPPVEPPDGAEPEAPQADEPPAAAQEPEIPPDWVTLGSVDPAGPYRMLVTLSNRGACVERIELSGRRFHDQEDRSGYMGHVVGDRFAAGEGCPVEVVGPGTPAAMAGVEKGDRITAVDGSGVAGFESLRRALRKTKPNETVRLKLTRHGEKMEVPVALRRRPLEVVRPEGTDPLSFLLTLSTLDDRTLSEIQEQFDRLKKTRDEIQQGFNELERSGSGQLSSQELARFKQGLNELDSAIAEFKGQKLREDARPRIGDLKTVALELHRLGLEIDGIDTLAFEIKGINLRSGTWEIVSHSQVEAVFRRVLAEWGLEVFKTYRLAEVPAESKEDRTYKGYHLELGVEIRNTGDDARKVGYQLDGPTGLPIEGYWYANKIGRRWGAVGLRDVVVSFGESREPDMIPCPKIADGELDPPWRDESLTFIGVDAQYFSSVMIPQKQDPGEIWFATSQPLRVGPVDKGWKKKTNTSCRVASLARDLEPGESLSHGYLVFAGPKNPDLLARYGLGELVYYGWFGWVARPMLWCLHEFYGLVHNYGLAIIMLTVLVRLGMFPMSKKQALGAQKMAELQPEIKKIHAKYKKDMEARSKAQQALFKKHNYNPLSGCLVLFFQLPIFLGLYRGLMVDVELRQAPLISESVRWCSNLAAPDMLFDWSGFMPKFVTETQSFFGLGPYFNLLPIITIGLFILQQKMFMPPPADEQAAMQQKVMKFMMVFMGIIFFKVASGLCIYFIASSLWGVAERKLLPKHTAPSSGDKSPPARAQPSRSAPGGAEKRNATAARKRRAEGDGAAAKKKRKKSRGKR